MPIYNVYCLKHKVWVRPMDLYPRHEYCEFAIPKPEPTLLQKLWQQLTKGKGE